MNTKIKLLSNQNWEPTILEKCDVLPKRHTVSFATCSCSDSCTASILRIAESIREIADIELNLLSTEAANVEGVKVVQVPPGTKLSKLRKFSQSINTDFICICDPDIVVEADAVRRVFELAFEAVESESDVVAFGLIECQCSGTLLSRVIAVDKWLSHRVLRPLLWRLKVGITIPGQFLVLSTSVLRGISPTVDSYLDDLYMGWIVRSRRGAVLRVNEVIGFEEPRSSWSTLLTQRIRWMRGLFTLAGHLTSQPKAIAFLLIHYIAYHGLPILFLFMLTCLAVFSPAGALLVFCIVATCVAILSRQTIAAAATYVMLFPLLHCLATLLWWVPLSRQRLTQR